MAPVRLRYAQLLFRRLWKFLAAYAGVLVFAALGFYVLESYTTAAELLNSFYWAMVTLSTIGYGDVVPNNPNAKLFTIGIAGLEVFLTAYLVTVVISIVQETAQHRLLGTLGTDFRNHIVVLGYSAVGAAAVRELLADDQQVAVVTENANEVGPMHNLASEKQLFVTYGHPGETEVLQRVNVAGAHAVIVCTGEDTTTLVAALNVRAIGPNIRIVVSVGRPELKQTLKAAGVTYIGIAGGHGGAALRRRRLPPRGRQHGRGPDEHGVRRRHGGVHPHHGDSDLLSDAPRDRVARPYRRSDCIVIGYARKGPDGEATTVLNPPSTFRFRPMDALIVVGTLPNLHRLQKWIGVTQGR